MKQQIIKTLLIAGLITSTAGTWAKAEENEAKAKGSIGSKGVPQAEFPKLAKISVEKATSIAKDKVPGSVLSVGLENEDGFLVYAVNITDQKSVHHEIIVDAGNGKILAEMKKDHSSKEKEDEEEDGDDD